MLLLPFITQRENILKKLEDRLLYKKNLLNKQVFLCYKRDICYNLVRYIQKECLIMRTKNGFFICKVTDEAIPSSLVPTYGKGIWKKGEETDKYIRYDFNWFDAVIFGGNESAGRFHDYEIWQLKENPKLYVIFGVYQEAFEHCRRKLNEEVGISLKQVSLDFLNGKHGANISIVKEKDTDVSEEDLEDEDLQYVFNPNKVNNDDIIKDSNGNLYSFTYHMPVKDKLVTIECFVDGRMRFGLQRDNEIVYELIKYALTFSKVSL